MLRSYKYIYSRRREDRIATLTFSYTLDTYIYRKTNGAYIVMMLNKYIYNYTLIKSHNLFCRSILPYPMNRMEPLYITQLSRSPLK